MDRLAAVHLGWLGRAEHSASWVQEGYRSFRSWIGHTHDVGARRAGALVRLAQRLRDTLPTTAAAARAGDLPVAKAELIAQAATSEARIEALTTAQADPADLAPGPRAAEAECGCDGCAACRAARARTGEQVLCDLSGMFSVDSFARVTRRFQKVSDPESDERGYREASDRQFVDLVKTFGGFHLSGFLADETAQLVTTALRAVGGVPAADCTSTAAQRRAVALGGLAKLVLDRGLAGQGSAVRPHLNVHVPLGELHRVLHGGHGCGGSFFDGSRPADTALEDLITVPAAEWEDGTGPVPDAVLRRLAADCDVMRVVFGPDSQVIDVGRAQRTFTGGMRRAVIARDRGCVWDGCDAPPVQCEVHHARVHWADGGGTSVPDGALLCWYHHAWVDKKQIPMRWRSTDSAAGVSEPGPVPGGSGSRGSVPRGSAPGGSGSRGPAPSRRARAAGHWQFGTPGTYRPDGGGHFLDDDGAGGGSFGGGATDRGSGDDEPP